MLCFKNLLQNLLLGLFFILVYVALCASASGGQDRVLDAQSCNYRQLWATHSGYWELNLGPPEQQQALVTSESSSLQPYWVFYMEWILHSFR